MRLSSTRLRTLSRVFNCYLVALHSRFILDQSRDRAIPSSGNKPAKVRQATCLQNDVQAVKAGIFVRAKVLVDPGRLMGLRERVTEL